VYYENTGINGKHICKEWNIPAFHYRHININHPERDIGRPRRRWEERQQY
jgi:hypothetical protein